MPLFLESKAFETCLLEDKVCLSGASSVSPVSPVHCLQMALRGLLRRASCERECTGVCLISEWVVEALQEWERAMPGWKGGLGNTAVG